MSNVPLYSLIKGKNKQNSFNWVMNCHTDDNGTYDDTTKYVTCNVDVPLPKKESAIDFGIMIDVNFMVHTNYMSVNEADCFIFLNVTSTTSGVSTMDYRWGSAGILFAHSYSPIGYYPYSSCFRWNFSESQNANSWKIGGYQLKLHPDRQYAIYGALYARIVYIYD